MRTYFKWQKEKKQSHVPSLTCPIISFCCLKTYTPKYFCNFNDLIKKNIRNSMYFLPCFTESIENSSVLNPYRTSGNWNCQAVKVKWLSNKDASSSIIQLLQLSEFLFASIVFILFNSLSSLSLKKIPQINQKTTTQKPPPNSLTS